MRAKRLLIMDYSVDRTENIHVRKWLPVGIEADVWLVNDGLPFPEGEKYSHIIHTGSALSILHDSSFIEQAEKLVGKAVESGIPQLGICFGHQLICRALMGKNSVRKCFSGIEAGWLRVIFNERGKEFLKIEKNQCTVFQYHLDEVVRIPSSAEVIAWNTHSGIQAYLDKKTRLLGLQFHPEFDEKSGNQEFLNSTEKLRKVGINVNELLSGKPEGFSTTSLFNSFISEL